MNGFRGESISDLHRADLTGSALCRIKAYPFVLRRRVICASSHFCCKPEFRGLNRKERVSATMADPRAYPVPEVWQEPIRAFLVYAGAIGRREETLHTFEERLSQLARSAPVGPYDFTQDHLIEFLSAKTHWATETRRSRLQTYRGFWDWAMLKNHVLTNPVEGLPRIPVSDPNPLPAPYRIYLAALLRADRRTRIILRLAGEVGLRRGEIALVQPPQDLLQTEEGWWLCVHGKGGKSRVVPVPEDIAHEILEFAGNSTWLLPGRKNGHLSARHAYVLASRVLSAPWSIHKLRHLFAKRSY